MACHDRPAARGFGQPASRARGFEPAPLGSAIGKPAAFLPRRGSILTARSPTMPRPELKRIRKEIERQHQAIEETLRVALRRLSDGGETQDELITIRGERFVIPVKQEFKRRIPGVVHGASSSGQTVYLEPLETIEQNNELVRLLDEEQTESRRIFTGMTREIGLQADAIVAGASSLAVLDGLQARARFAAALTACVRNLPLPAPAGSR